MTDIRIHKIIKNSLVDGPGKRAVLFVQGCPIECVGCQNKHIWSNREGELIDVRIVADALAEYASEHGQITISGGDPFAQPRALAALLRALRADARVKHIIVYTGFIWEFLVSPLQPVSSHASIIAALSNIDVLVDGPYIKALDDKTITYRGSRNQRPIDVAASLATWGDPEIGPVVLDWDNPEIVIDKNGNITLPIGLVSDFTEIGAVEKTRMCGQTRSKNG